MTRGRKKLPNDVLALGEFYAAIKDEPYNTQRAAINWLSARIEADEAKRRDHLISLEVPHA